MGDFLTELGFDIESEAFKSAWFNDPLFNRAVMDGQMSLADICVLLSNARIMDQDSHIEYVSKCTCMITGRRIDNLIQEIAEEV